MFQQQPYKKTSPGENSFSFDKSKKGRTSLAPHRSTALLFRVIPLSPPIASMGGVAFLPFPVGRVRSGAGDGVEVHGAGGALGRGEDREPPGERETRGVRPALGVRTETAVRKQCPVCGEYRVQLWQEMFFQKSNWFCWLKRLLMLEQPLGGSVDHFPKAPSKARRC